MKWLFLRLSEPSTWAGFAGLIPALVAVAAGGPVTSQAIGGIVAGAAAVLLREKGAAQ